MGAAEATVGDFLSPSQLEALAESLPDVPRARRLRLYSPAELERLAREPVRRARPVVLRTAPRPRQRQRRSTRPSASARAKSGDSDGGPARRGRTCVVTLRPEAAHVEAAIRFLVESVVDEVLENLRSAAPAALTAGAAGKESLT